MVSLAFMLFRHTRYNKAPWLFLAIVLYIVTIYAGTSHIMIDAENKMTENQFTDQKSVKIIETNLYYALTDPEKKDYHIKSINTIATKNGKRYTMSIHPDGGTTTECDISEEEYQKVKDADKIEVTVQKVLLYIKDKNDYYKYGSRNCLTLPWDNPLQRNNSKALTEIQNWILDENIIGWTVTINTKDTLDKYPDYVQKSDLTPVKNITLKQEINN